MEAVIYLCLEILDIYILHKIMYIFFEARKVKKPTEAAAYILKLCVSGAADYLGGGVGKIAAVFVCYFLLAFCYDSPLSKKCFAVFFTSAAKIVSNTAGAAVIGNTGFWFWDNTAAVNYIGVLITEMFFWITAFLLEMYRNGKEELQIPKRFMIAGILVQMLSVLAGHVIYIESGREMYGADIILALFAASNFVIIYVYDSMLKVVAEKAQIKHMQHQIYYNHQTELLQSNQKNLRQFRHDIRNRLYALEGMLKQGRYQEAEKYLEQIAGKVEYVKMYSETGNIAVDGIINYKLAEAETNKIKVSYDIVLPETIKVQEDDMIVVLGNLLDNAIEAAKNMENERRLALRMEYDKGCVFLCVRNTYCHEIEEREGKFVTSKRDKELHGIGLQSVDSVIRRYGGMKEVSYNEKEFCVDIVLPVEK